LTPAHVLMRVHRRSASKGGGMDETLRNALTRQPPPEDGQLVKDPDALIMMVDDEPIVMEVVRSWLEERGYTRFLLCEDSRLALEMIERHRPDVLLLDLVMPEVTGFDLLLALRAQDETEHLSVIVLTSSSDAETKLKALELGATDFLAKPVDPSELSLRLRNTLSAKAYQDSLENTDTLTGLDNRKRLTELLGLVVGRPQQVDEEGFLLMLGIDKFKAVNQSLGPAAGDDVLRQLAKRLEFVVLDHEWIGPATLARAGGDEFAILLREWPRDEVLQLARALSEELANPFQVQNESIFLTGGIGIAIVADADSPDALLQQASIAQRHARRSKENSVEFYSSEIDAEAREMLLLESDLRHALERDEFELHFQPKIESRTRRVAGVEALIRWRRKGRLEPPSRFIPLAEETGLIIQLGEWVIKEACRRAKEFERAGFDMSVAVNVSSQQVSGVNLLSVIRRALEDSGLNPSKLIVEITESVIMEDVVSTLVVLDGIRALGVTLSIDDFGTGYSSLSYLTRLPISELKIDRSFMAGVPDEATNVAVVKSVLALARSLDLSVTAEGIETSEQAKFLADHGCAKLQGYYFSKPLPFDELLPKLTKGRKRNVS
jgi:diguanylate cyclase (GGDEF)-like protein